MVLMTMAFGLEISEPALAKPPVAALAAGERLIPITTPNGSYHVWVKTVGDPNAKVRLLLLHGGPGTTHEYLENFEQALVPQGIQIIFYDQLGSGLSDHPDDDRLWTVDRFVDEVEQVRTALKLNAQDFCLLGHSWGGILAIEYALKYQQNLKCLVISNMMASAPAYNAYTKKVLEPAMDQASLAEVKSLEASGKTDDPRYTQLIMPMHYEQHFLRRPADKWPEPVNRAFGHLNQHLYTLMQGPSELGLSGRLSNWDRFADLSKIRTTTLVIGARYDEMDPVYLASMAQKLPNGEFLYLSNASHMAMWDDPQRYFAGLGAYLKSLR
jgi:proline iminopeptidase